MSSWMRYTSLKPSTELGLIMSTIEMMFSETLFSCRQMKVT